MRITITITETDNMYDKLHDWKEVENGFEKTIEISGEANANTIEKLVRMMAQADKLNPNDVLNRKDYIATTLWSEEDIGARLEEKGYDASDENIAAVIKAGELNHLGDCLDEHWETIDQAIKNADLQATPYTLHELLVVLQDVVACEADSYCDMEAAEKKLIEMGFTYDQLTFFGIHKNEDAICVFEDTYREVTSEREAAMKLLTSVVAWYKNHCADLDSAKQKLEEIGFEEDLISLCNF